MQAFDIFPSSFEKCHSNKICCTRLRFTGSDCSMLTRSRVLPILPSHDISPNSCEHDIISTAVSLTLLRLGQRKCMGVPWACGDSNWLCVWYNQRTSLERNPSGPCCSRKQQMHCDQSSSHTGDNYCCHLQIS